MSVLTPFKPGLFAGRGIIVTGGGTGLGKAIALVRVLIRPTHPSTHTTTPPTLQTHTLPARNWWRSVRKW